MKNSDNKQQISFTYLPEKDEYEVKIGDQIYESEDKCFSDVEDELNDVQISELPSDITIHHMLQETYLDIEFGRNKKDLVKADINLSFPRKFWYGDIGLDNYLAAYEKLLLKHSSLNVSIINKEIDVDCPLLSFSLELEANCVVDVFNTVRALDVKIQNEISKAVVDTLNYFWKILMGETEHKSE